MARFDDDWLTRLKAEISLERLVESSGVVLKRHGKDLVGHCPFHDDKTPSLVVTPSSNLWHCLGACNTGGSVIDWVMQAQGVSFRHAVELLRHDMACPDASSPLAASASPVKNTTVPKLPAPVSLDVDDQLLLNQVVDFYHETLKTAPEAIAYLEKRGLADAELIDTFKLGYANRTLGLRLPQKNRKSGKAVREQLQRIGLYRDTGREHFAGSLVIPVLAADGHVTEIYGRKLNDNLRKGTPKHTYLPGPHAGVFNSDCLAHADELILCESLLDALTFWWFGYRHVTNSFGVNGLTEEMVTAFAHHNIKRLLIAYDRDAAGDKAASAAAAVLQPHGIACYRLLFPLNQDVNGFACEATDPQAALAAVIRRAEWLGEGASPDTNDNESAVVDRDATPVPPAPLADVQLTEKDGDLWLALGEAASARCYRVRGLDASREDQLRVQLLVKLASSDTSLLAAPSLSSGAFHLDRLDLTSSKQRQVFVNQASAELGVSDKVIKGDLGKVLLTLETYVAEQHTPVDDNATEVTLTSAEREAALELLQDPKLMDRIVDDLSQIGVVGETGNALVGYLACVSRLLSKPLAVLIQSSSAAGKSALMEAVLSLMPVEARVQYSAMTGQSVLHQYQRELKTVKHGDTELEYIEVTLADIDIANRLVKDVLGKTLDELPPQTRRLLSMITDLVKDRCQREGITQRDLRFSRKEVRACCGWSETQVRLHTQRLVEMEYLLIHRGGRGQSFEYELLYQEEGDAGDRFVMGLTDIAQLKEKPSRSVTTTGASRGQKGQFAGSSRADRGPIADLENRRNTSSDKAARKTSRVSTQRTVQG